MKRSRRCNRQSTCGVQHATVIRSGRLILAVLALSLQTRGSVVRGTIVAPMTTNNDVAKRKYQSQPALFGMELEYDRTYNAILQSIPDDPYLCAGVRSNDKQSVSNDEVKKQFGDPNPNADADMILIPQDGESIALLAKRGSCSFEVKARTALAMDAILQSRLRKRRSKQDASSRDNGPKSETEKNDTRVIQFVIVYDDVSRPTLVPMSASHDGEINDIGLVFVSSDAGDDLLGLVESDAKSGFGVPITIDATAPWGGYGYTYNYGLYGETYPREFILAAMAGFFMCLALLGCLLLCAQAGFISTDGNLVVFGRTLADEIMARRESVRRVEQPRLLTGEQVMALPVVQYCTSGKVVNAGHRRMDRTESMPITVTTERNPLERRSASSLDYQARDAVNICDICIDEYVDGELLSELPCGHRYHSECILPWLTKRSSRCPHCRANVWNADPYAEESQAFDAPTTSTPLVGPHRSTADTYGSTSFGDFSPLHYLRDAWQSSASLSDEIDIGIGVRHDFSDSDTENVNASSAQ